MAARVLLELKAKPDTVRLVRVWLDRGGIGGRGGCFRSVGKGGRIGERLHPSLAKRLSKLVNGGWNKHRCGRLRRTASSLPAARILSVAESSVG